MSSVNATRIQELEELTPSPRNHVPWIIIGICYVICMGLLLAIRYLLSSENKRRDNEPVDDTYDDVYIEKVGLDGVVEKVKVDKVCHSVFPLGKFANSCIYFVRNSWISQTFKTESSDTFYRIFGWQGYLLVYYNALMQ